MNYESREFWMIKKKLSLPVLPTASLGSGFYCVDWLRQVINMYERKQLHNILLRTSICRHSLKFYLTSTNIYVRDFK